MDTPDLPDDDEWGEVATLPGPPNGRVETGPVQFGDDWPGIFIRGDQAVFFAMILGMAIKQKNGEFEDLDEINKKILDKSLDSLKSLFDSCVINFNPPP